MSEIPKTNSSHPEFLQRGMVSWSSPSNIALVKYWGKRGNQLPENPSLSITLSKSYTLTEIEFQLTEEGRITREFYFEGKREPEFEPKLDDFFSRVLPHLNFPESVHLIIRSSNTFPHSTGIASSASAMSALALCVLDLERKLNDREEYNEAFFTKASFLSRLGSGSACRSVFPEVSVWGETENLPGSSDEFGIKVKLKKSSAFKGLRDAILIVSSEKKKVSSTGGHKLMETNPYASGRYLHARENLSALLEAMENDDLKNFIEITENEALTLHGLMMSSRPGYILMKNGSLEIIEKIRDFREKTGKFITFTLDAGPNVHLLYFEKDSDDIRPFIENELSGYTESGNIIWDGIGEGPQKLK